MIMIETRNKVAEAMAVELANADRHGNMYNTNHEAYAILKEEIEEAQNEMQSLITSLNNLWNAVKSNDGEVLDEALADANNFSFWLSCEAIQCNAVIQKWMRGVHNEN